MKVGDEFFDEERGVTLKVIEIREEGRKPITVEFTADFTDEKGRGDTTPDWLRNNCTKINNDPFTKDKRKLKL